MRPVDDERPLDVLLFPMEDDSIGRVTFEGLDAIEAARGELLSYERQDVPFTRGEWVYVIEGSTWLRVPNGQLVLRLDADFRLPEDAAVDRLARAVLDEPEAGGTSVTATTGGPMSIELGVFAEPSVARTSALGRVEPAVHWFTESTRPEASASRETVNRWYREVDDANGHFARRLRSEIDVDHYQALDELHIHHLLRTRHDDVVRGGFGTDFRVYDAGTCVRAVEMLSLLRAR